MLPTSLSLPPHCRRYAVAVLSVLAIASAVVLLPASDAGAQVIDECHQVFPPAVEVCPEQEIEDLVSNPPGAEDVVDSAEAVIEFAEGLRLNGQDAVHLCGLARRGVLDTEVNTDYWKSFNRAVENMLSSHWAGWEVTKEEFDACLQARFGMVPVEPIPGSALLDRLPPTVCEFACGPGIMSVEGDVAMTLPDVYFSGPFGQYLAISSWQWNGRPEAYTGGPDGVAISVNDVDLVDDAYFYSNIRADTDDCSKQTARATHRSFNNGLGFRLQDAQRGYPCQGYDWDHGYMYMTFNPYVGCRRYDFFSNFSHTWENTGLDSISFGAGGVSFTYGSQGYQWDFTTNPASYEICG